MMVPKQTPLYRTCLNQKAKFSPFAGWEMPIQFSSLLKEHQAVRETAGIFDISHMGIFEIEGRNAKAIMQNLVPTDLNRIGPAEACYTVLLNEEGGIIDDLIIYDLGSNKNNLEKLAIVINAGRTKDDISWLKANLSNKDISINDKKKDGVFLAIQGPNAIKILEEFLNSTLHDIPRFGHRYIQLNYTDLKESSSLFIARTGYTGEDGFEIMLDAETGIHLWKGLINKGVTPCGLGARDTLRQEASMHLYGHEINQTTTPFEAGLGWLVHLEMQSKFIGREALEKQAKEGVKKKLVGMKMQNRAIAREGYPVLNNGKKIGHITSGTWSPTLKEAIAMAYVPTEFASTNQNLEIEIRGKAYSSMVVKRPFYSRK